MCSYFFVLGIILLSLCTGTYSKTSALEKLIKRASNLMYNFGLDVIPVKDIGHRENKHVLGFEFLREYEARAGKCSNLTRAEKSGDLKLIAGSNNETINRRFFDLAMTINGLECTYNYKSMFLGVGPKLGLIVKPSSNEIGLRLETRVVEGECFLKVVETDRFDLDNIVAKTQGLWFLSRFFDKMALQLVKTQMIMSAQHRIQRFLSIALEKAADNEMCFLIHKSAN